MIRYLYPYARIRQASKAYKAKIKNIASLYNGLDKEIAKFRRTSGINCLAGCGECCKYPKIETTVLELLPLAIHLWRKNQAEFWLDKAYESGLKGPCIFYKPQGNHPLKGRCPIYKLRPLICRLFGFSAIKGESQNNILVACKYIKNSYPGMHKSLEKPTKAKTSIPLQTNFSGKLMSIDLALGIKLYPINQSIALAIEKIGFDLQMQKRKIQKA